MEARSVTRPAKLYSTTRTNSGVEESLAWGGGQRKSQNSTQRTESGLTREGQLLGFVCEQAETIEADIRALPLEQAEQLQDWLSEYLEERAELNPKFVESIERGKADLRAGRVRVEKPLGILPQSH